MRDKCVQIYKFFLSVFKSNKNNLYIWLMVTKSITLYGGIGEGYGATLVSVMADVKALGDFDVLNVRIEDNIGGFVDTAFDICNYLRELKKQGKQVHTTAAGFVASSATFIFCIGSVRKADEERGCELLIHPCWIPDAWGNASELLEAAEELQAIDKEVGKLYAEATGLTAQEISALMARDTYISAEQAYQLGFLNVQPVKVDMPEEWSIEIGAEMRAAACAAFKKSLSIKINTNMSKEQKKGWFAGVKATIRKFLAATYQDANGQEVQFPDLESGVAPSAGDAIVVPEGLPASGSIVLPQFDNLTVEYDAGVVTNVVEATQEGDETEAKAEGEDPGEGAEATLEELTTTLEDAATVIETLEAQVETLTAENERLAEENASQARAMAALRTRLKGPAGNHQARTTQDTDDSNKKLDAKSVVAKIKETAAARRN